MYRPRGSKRGHVSRVSPDVTCARHACEPGRRARRSYSAATVTSITRGSRRLASHSRMEDVRAPTEVETAYASHAPSADHARSNTPTGGVMYRTRTAAAATRGAERRVLHTHTTARARTAVVI